MVKLEYMLKMIIILQFRQCCPD